MSKSKNTVNEFLEQGRTMDVLTSRPSMAISDSSLVTGTPIAIREWLIALQAAHPAKPSQSPESEKVQVMSEICGHLQSMPFALYDRFSCSLKMCQGCLIQDISKPFSVTFPKSGMMLDGRAYRLQTAERRTNENGYGLRLPTPTASMVTLQDFEQAKTAGNSKKRKKYSDHAGGTLNPEYREWLMGVPINWSACEPLETAKFPLWRRLHGKS